MAEWFENELFWVETYAFMFDEARFASAVDGVDKVLKLVPLRGSAVLDLCCGPGRFSLALAERGFAVTGVDITGFLLDKAKARAEQQNVKVEWIKEDMRRFVRPEAFDLVINMFTSFGYFDDKREDMVVLDNVFRSLKPGGTFLIDVMGKERLARIFQPTMSNVMPDGGLLVQRHEILDDWTRERTEWIVIRDGGVKVFKLSLTVYSGQELKDLLIQAGFQEVRLYGNLDGDEYGIDAQRLIAVGIKPEA